MISVRDKVSALGKWVASAASGAALVLLIAGEVRLARSQEIKYGADPFGIYDCNH